LQWLIVLTPGLLVLGEVVALAQGLGPTESVAFLQRLLLLCALAQAAQVWAGHRMPGLVGPSAALMVGILSTVDAEAPAVYGAMAVAGGATALAGFTGLAARLLRLFTPPVLATTLILIAMTLAPPARDLCFHPDTAGGPGVSFTFALALALAMFWGQRTLKGIWSSAAVLLGLVLGSAVFHLAGLSTGPPAAPLAAGWGLPALFPARLEFHPGVIAAFILCYLALMSNELATVEALGRILKSPNLDSRQNRAVAASGLGGVLAGFMGVPGPVTYSVSPGVIISSRNASRLVLLPTAALTAGLAVFPQALALFKLTPPPVIGALLLFLMSATVFASLSLLVPKGQALSWSDGVVVGLAMIVGLLVAFMPPAAKDALPPLLRPVLANGFVAGLAIALIMEHVMFRKKRPRPNGPEGAAGEEGPFQPKPGP
jgi:uracil permease